MKLKNIGSHKEHSIVQVDTSKRGALIFCNTCFEWLGSKKEVSKLIAGEFPKGRVSEEAFEFFRDVDRKAREIRDIFENYYPEEKLGKKFRKFPLEWFIKKLGLEECLKMMTGALVKTKDSDNAKKSFTETGWSKCKKLDIQN